MTIHARIRTAAVVCATATAMFLGGTTLPTITPVASAAGPCLFGHVDPNNSNSACRGSESAKWPESEQTADGSPALTCSRLNDGAHVRTHDGLGWRYWLCKKYKDSWGHTYYQWTEVLGQ
jgi:predicted lipoprotein with Yx(FWY)xxD motif